jgi:hypothetical protein
MPICAKNVRAPVDGGLKSAAVIGVNHDLTSRTGKELVSRSD